jgi:TolB-like protein
LAKPKEFRPDAYAIVRVHARRLRLALEKYYSKDGQEDSIRISIPKGSYVPNFDKNIHTIEEQFNDEKKTIVIGVAPFQILAPGNLSNTFAEGLGIQLSSTLAQQKHFSVVSYYSMKRFFANKASLKYIRATTGADVIVIGEIQMMKDFLRIYVQSVRTSDSQLMSSQIFESGYEESKIFAIQDEIVGKILFEVISQDVAA